MNIQTTYTHSPNQSSRSRKFREILTSSKNSKLRLNVRQSVPEYRHVTHNELRLPDIAVNPKMSRYKEAAKEDLLVSR